MRSVSAVLVATALLLVADALELVDNKDGSSGSSTNNNLRRAAGTGYNPMNDYNRIRNANDPYRKKLRKNNRPTYSEPLPEHYRPVLSFQMHSYVEDDTPMLIFHQESGGRTPIEKVRQISTITDGLDKPIKRYFDEYDDHLGLTKHEERRKIFYNDDPLLMPAPKRD